MGDLNASPTGFTDEFIKLTHDYTGITIKPGRSTMLESRLRKRLRDLELDDFSDYLTYLKRQPAEKEKYVNAVTTNETYFYRTPRIWEYIQDQFLPQWYEHAKCKSLSVWSAASSTGEEAHTLGIVLQSFKEKNTGFDYRITGTDIDSSVVEKAKTGSYKGRSIERFKQARSDLFETYMVGDDEVGYEVQSHIKSRLRFSVLNLFDAAPTMDKYDLVLLRNVLIYFSKDDQEKVMATVHNQLKNDGVVVIGESESLNNVQTDFHCLAPTIYRPLSECQERKFS